jgi:NAD(P)-dependent dehydrogenase (short-subunit alcohol dehydrogenase family)
VELGLSGNVVVVTGGCGGIGQGLLLAFAREGANVISASRDEAPGGRTARLAKSQALVGSIVPVATDVTRRASVDAMLAVAHERFGPVDVLVNNAGGVWRHTAFEELDDETRRWELALNIDGVVNTTLAVAPTTFPAMS